MKDKVKAGKIASSENIVILFSLLAIICFWVVDATVDSLLYSDESFLHLLFYDNQAVYFRMLVCAAFMTYGLVLAKFIKSRNLINESLVESEGRYRSLVDSTDNSIYVVDRDCRYIYMNRMHIDRLEVPGADYRVHDFGDFHSQEEKRLFVEKIENIFSTGASAIHEYKSLRDNRYFLQSYSPVKDERGGVIAVTVVSQEITHLKELEEKLHELSLTDELTGLYNRRGFFALAERELKISRRYNCRKFLLFTDMDDLKKINDNLGHDLGDRAIKDTANILRDTYRESDIIARIGGDEFVLFPVGSDETDVSAVAARLQRSLAAFNLNSDLPFALSLSIGIIPYDSDYNSSVDNLLLKADRLMYENKNKKKETLSK